MYFNLLTSFLAISALTCQAKALGINCRGSLYCETGTMTTISDYVNKIHGDRLYTNGQHIACVRYLGGDGTCVFIQGSDHQVSGGVIKDLIKGLVNHGCRGCGSNPLYNYGASPSNDPQWGILTVNYVVNAGLCSGVC